VQSCHTVLTGAMQREILSLLARSGDVTVPAATAEVAADWRRRRQGHSPSWTGTTTALVFQVGVELAESEAAARRGGRRAPSPSRLGGARRKP
jgi:hypothetical protein